MVTGTVRRFCKLAAAGLAGLLASTAAAAQDAEPDQSAPAPGVVAATQAQGVLAAVTAAGYQAQFLEREGGASATIEIDSDGLLSLIVFDDCNDAIPDFCETLVLSTKWDRAVPISDAAIASANQQHKYVSVWRDEDGDPLLQWAIITGREGIPTPVFLSALDRYLSVAQDFWDVAFEGDEARSPDPSEQATDADTAS